MQFCVTSCAMFNLGLADLIRVPVSAKCIKFLSISQHIWNCLRAEIHSTTGKNI